ncbi:MAG: alanine--glyoxylate aminotransferase family protein [Gemmataceae bacterium]|nr:alanine--glyoxylate aminotransferase family protein [Gemmataceae bacterium]MDW8243703.1 alanine--glyoxylate aminotransferase family protein [Thermogemmata sp.]
MRKSRLFTPGPTPVPEEVLLELARPVGYHRSAEAKATLAEVVRGLQYVLQTEQPVYVLTCSGTGAMEAAVSSVVAPGEKVILCTAGRWGERWRGILKAHGAELIAVEAPYGQAVTSDQLADALTHHPDAVAVYTTLCETSTGVGHDIAAFARLTAASSALLVVDGISGIGAMECRMDAWGIDVLVTGSQKALMMPPGLAYVAVSPKAWRKIEATPVRNFYFDLRRYRKALAEGPDTPFTPANTLIRAQRLALERLRAEGMEQVWARHARLAQATRTAVQALGLELFAQRPSNALTVIRVPAGVDGTGLLKKLEQHFGYKLADGQDTLKGKIWRLSHMGYVDPFDVLGAIAALELTLHSQGLAVPLGAGVAAFQREYARAQAL